MDYLVLAAALVAGFHACTYAGWLKKTGNKPGAVGVVVLIVVSLALPVFRLIRSP